MINPSCPYCKGNHTRFMHRIFDKEVYLCNDCLKSFSVKHDDYTIKLTPRKA